VQCLRRGLAVLTALLALPAPAAAQAQLPSWFSIDTTAAVDRVLTSSDATAGVILDTFMSARIAPGLEIYTRPFVQRLGTGEWNRQPARAGAVQPARHAARRHLSVRSQRHGVRREVGCASGAD
jgi:hypothetical protein